MRKDVRIGLAIGGILFIVVLSYVLFFTGPKPKQVSDARTTPSAKSTDSERAATHDDAPAANSGSSGTDITIAPPPGAFNSEPIARTQTPNPASPTASSPAPPAPRPALTGADAGTQTPAPAPAPTNGTDWAGLLDHGEGGVARTTTPPTTPTDPVVAPPDPGAATPSPAPSTIAPPPVVPATPGRTHLVKQGESYWSIAEAEYGNGAYMSHLIKANPKYPANKLRAGVSITVPPKDQVVRPGNGGGSSPIASGPTTRPFDATTHYKVKQGDSLFSISKALYGRTDRVNKIYEMNRDAIGPDPKVLKLGTVLQLPEPPKSAATTAGPVADIAH